MISATVYFGAQDGTYKISATKNMEVPPSLAYQAAQDYKQWMVWGPWMELDPNIQIALNDTTTGLNGGYQWKSDHPDIGKGALKTKSLEENKSILQDISFDMPYGSLDGEMFWNFEPLDTPNTVAVTWGIQGELGLLDKMYAALKPSSTQTKTKDLYEQGLLSMEQTILAAMKQHTVSFDGLSEYGGGYYMYVTAASNRAGLSAKMGPMLAQVNNYMQSNKIVSTGMPFTIYNQIDETTGNLIFSTCIPVKERVIPVATSAVLCGYMPPLTAIKTTLRGNYDHLEEAYQAGYDYIYQKGLTIDGKNPIFEIYVTDPGEEPNPANWITEVYIPIETPWETIN